jgi:hypothetical protein
VAQEPATSILLSEFRSSRNHTNARQWKYSQHQTRISPIQKTTRQAMCLWRNTETLSRNHSTVEKQEVCVNRFSNPAFNTHALYFIVICGLAGSIIYIPPPPPSTKMCLDIFYKFCLKCFHSIKNSARFYRKRTWVFMYSARYFCRILLKLLSRRQIFETSSNIRFH